MLMTKAKFAAQAKRPVKSVLYVACAVTRKVLKRSIPVFAALVFSSTAVAADLRINKVSGEKEQLIHSILKLAWSKVEPNGKIQESNEESPVSRLPVEVDEQRIDLMWAGASEKNDTHMEAVRIPLLKGMLGHRIFIIRKGDQTRFNNIQSVSDLARLDAGMGRSWGSTKVLEQAGLPVVSSLKYENLFHMLDGSRFDYFPRAVHEPWIELAKHSELDLAVENRLLLVYPYAMYFYVKKDNKSLKQKLTNGLEMAIADGSFDALFYSNPMVKAALSRGKLNERLILRIPNPAMHADTPTNRPELWLDVQKLPH